MATGRPDFWNLVSLVDRPYAPVGFPHVHQVAGWGPDTVAAGTSMDVLSALGTGWFQYCYNRWVGPTTPWDLHVYIYTDGARWWHRGDPADMYGRGMTSPGAYPFVGWGVWVQTYDTTSGRFASWGTYEPFFMTFRDTLEVKLENQSLDDASVYVTVTWKALVASEELGCHLERMPTVEELEDLRDRLRQEGAVVEALVAINGKPPLLTVHVEAVGRRLPEALLHHTRHLAGGPRQVMGRRELRELRRRLAMEALRLEAELLQQHGNAHGAVQLQNPGAR